jgi:hypothetical protein
MQVSIADSQQILNVVPADYDHDGYLDLLVMSGPKNPAELDLAGIKNDIFLNNGRSLSNFQLIIMVLINF